MSSSILEQVEAQLVDLGFDPFEPTLKLARRLLRGRKSGREGLFVHALPGGREFYLGTSVDVATRVLRDLADEGDIESTAFIQGEISLLAWIETDILRRIRRHRGLIRGTIQPAPGGWQLDLPALSEWVRRTQRVFDRPPPPRPVEELAAFDARMEELRAHPRFDDRLLDLFSAYIRRCLPDPLATEGVFWSLTCRTPVGSAHPEAKTLARLSVRRPEVLGVLPAPEAAPRDAAVITMTVASEVLDPRAFARLHALPSLEIRENVYRTADFPHHHFTVHSYKEARRMLRIPAFIQACRLANLRLMRAGTLHPHVAAAHNHRLVQATLSRMPLD